MCTEYVLHCDGCGPDGRGCRNPWLVVSQFLCSHGNDHGVCATPKLIVSDNLEIYPRRVYCWTCRNKWVPSFHVYRLRLRSSISICTPFARSNTVKIYILYCDANRSSAYKGPLPIIFPQGGSTCLLSCQAWRSYFPFPRRHKRKGPLLKILTRAEMWGPMCSIWKLVNVH